MGEGMSDRFTTVDITKVDDELLLSVDPEVWSHVIDWFNPNIWSDTEGELQGHRFLRKTTLFTLKWW
jgi:hypothetical protein